MSHDRATTPAASPPGPPPAPGVWAAGADAPEKRSLRVGFIALTDCAPVVMAAQLGFDLKHGIRIVPSREASWAALRDRLLAGELDAAQLLYGLAYGVHLGIGGPRRPMAVLMTLNQNGQGITLSRQLRDAGAHDGGTLARLVRARQRAFTFAQTFPTGTHAMWLNYWLAAHGIDPGIDVRTITVPPVQMVANLRAGRIQGCSVGEPWNQCAIAEGVGFTAATSQDVWPDHPEKVLGSTADFADSHPHAARALVAAVLEAARWIDASEANRRRTAETLAAPDCVDADAGLILGRMAGRYDDGNGRRWSDPHAMRFFGDGEVSFPWLSDGMWFMTQQRRWGLLDADPDYAGVAAAVNRLAIYRDGAAAAGVAVPGASMRRSVLADGIVWDGSDPAGYAAGFAIAARAAARTGASAGA